MTKEEAIEELKVYEEYTCNNLSKAFKVAIESMEKLIELEKWMEDKTDDMR